MFGFLKRLFGRNVPKEEIDPDDVAGEQWNADFSRNDEPGKVPHVRFSITSENAYRAYLENNALCLALNKTNCIVWTEDMIYRYQDLDMKGWFRLDSRGGYAAAGFIFRMVDEMTYYLVLVSNRGYFRLDVVRNGVPHVLAGWTEAPEVRASGDSIDFDVEVLCYGSRILLAINEYWAGVWDDHSIPLGRIGFAAASYETALEVSGSPAALAMLLEFSLDSRIDTVEERFTAMENAPAADSRIRLAETFTAMGLADAALSQLRKAWESRDVLAAELQNAEDKVVLAAIQTEEPVRTAKELLLGTRLALALKLWDDAEKYIEELLGIEGEEKEARNLKAALLYSCSRYGDLIQWALECAGKARESPPFEIDGTGRFEDAFDDPSAICNLLGHAYFNTGDYETAVTAYDRAFTLDEKNGLAAKNAAAACELLNKGEEALARYLAAGRVFLAGSRYDELGLIVPKLTMLGKKNWEAAALAGKWAFGIENWKAAGEELERAEQLRKSAKTKHSPDPALYFLQGLLRSHEGKRREALGLFEKAVKYAPDYPLFRFRLAENRFLLNNNSDDPCLASDMEAALLVKKEEESETYGWVHNFAAHLALSRGDRKAARLHLDNAAAVLGEVPAVRVNRAVSLYLEGNEEGALAILESKPEEDPEGLMANCAGNLLVRSRRFEDADPWYRRALAASPLNVQYRYNRASCLIELARYGEADDVLTAGRGRLVFSPESSPDMLELIAFVSIKKGEYRRAEAAANSALKIDPGHVPSLLQLGWIRAFAGRWNEVADILGKLDELDVTGDNRKGRNDLAAWMEEALYKTAACASCGREWKVERNPAPVPSLRFYAMPPDDLPAGNCPACGKTYCVGCRKDAVDESGRLVCPDCGKALKLTDDGLRALLHKWAKKNIKQKRKKTKEETGENTQVSPDIPKEEAPN